jgi:hypothetical protein
VRFFVVCTSEVDGAPYVLSEVSEPAGPGRDATISGGIAGDRSVVMTRSEMDADSATRIALHAWDAGDDTAFNRQASAGAARTEPGRRARVVSDGDARPPARDIDRRRDLDARVAQAQAVRLRAVEMRVRCEEMREATMKQRRHSIALRDAMKFRTPFVKLDDN